MKTKLKEKKIFKTFQAIDTKVADDAPRTLVAKISAPSLDRSHDIVIQDGMVADNFLKNPVVLFAHNYADMPIAKCTGLKVTDTGILATVQFPDEGIYPKADTVYQMYKKGFLNAWSVGFMPLDYEENDKGGYTFKKWEIFEFSSVPVPDQPEALTIMRSKGINIDALFEKGVLPYKETPKASEDTAWDAGVEIKAATVDDLKIMCTWVDSENVDNKGAYKLPHHLAAGEHAVVWRGVAAAMGALLGARGGVDIPSSDRRGCYNHLSQHYKQFDKQPPEFKEYTQKELKSLFPQFYQDEIQIIIFSEKDEYMSLEFKDGRQIIFPCVPHLIRELKEDRQAFMELKRGRTISAKHEGMLRDACDHLDKAAEQVKTVLSSVVPDPGDENPNDNDDGKDDGDKSTTHMSSFLQKLANSLKTNNQKTDLTLRLLKTIVSERKEVKNI